MKKLLALLLALLMCLAAFAGCGEKDPNQGQSQGNSNDPQSPPQQETPKEYGWYRTFWLSSPPTFNVYVNTSTQAGEVANLCQYTLYRQSLNDTRDGTVYKPELADGMPEKVDSEGKVWKVKMWKDAKWQNGDKITADDMLFAVKTLIDPIQLNVNASLLTSHAVRIANSKQYHDQGSANNVSFDTVGFKKLDDYTLEITLENPVSEIALLKFLSSYWVSPIHKATFEKSLSEDKSQSLYGTSLDNFISSGRFILTGWVQDGKYTLTKNPDYRYADEIKIEGIIFNVVPDSGTALELFLNGELDYCSIKASQWEQYQDDPRVKEYFDDSNMYMFINTGNPNQNNIIGNLNFRKAISAGIDRVSIANLVHAYPSARYVRRAVVGDASTGVAFVDMPGSKDYVQDPTKIYNKEEANKYLAKALEEVNLDKATFELIYSETSSTGRPIGEFLQKDFSNVFGDKLTLTLRAVPSSQIYSLRRYNPADPSAFDGSIGSLYPSADVMYDSFRFFISDYSPPRTAWKSPEYDKIFAETQTLEASLDNNKMVKLCQQLEKMILDNLVVVPVYETPARVLFSERIELPVENYVLGYAFGAPAYVTIKK